MLSKNLSFHRAVAMKCASPWIIEKHENHDFSKTKGEPFVFCLDSHGLAMEANDSCRFHGFPMHTAMFFPIPQININMNISQNLAPNTPTTWHEVIGLMGDSQFSYAYSYDFDRRSQFAKLWYLNAWLFIETLRVRNFWVKNAVWKLNFP